MTPPDATARAHGGLQDFAAALLRHEGALVEPIEPQGLEILAPAAVQRALALPEMSRLGFGVTLPEGARRVGLEGDWLDRFSRLLESQGRWCRRIMPFAGKAPGDPEALLGHALVLGNATFRLLDVSPAWTRYLIMDFRASAVSDDKRDFMLRLGVNLATGAMPDAVVTALSPIIAEPSPWGGADAGLAGAEMPGNAAMPEMWDRGRLLDLVARGLTPRLDLVMEPFVKGLRRRLARDQDRLYDYHGDLHREALARAAALPGTDPKRLRDEQRAEAIVREYKAKLEDLTRQYATRVRVEWVRTLDLAMPVQRFTVQIRRRKADRLVRLDWNPVARRLESPVCEFTASVERPSLMCDDALHFLVPAGLAPCAGCNRPFCRACHRKSCPKCGCAVADRMPAAAGDAQRRDVTADIERQ